MKVHFSSDRQDWETPQAFFDLLDEEFGFQLDVCATRKNRKLPKFFSPEDDALQQMWLGKCWMNPPYGKGITEWVRKAYEESRYAKTMVVALLPARTDTKWWHRYVMRASEVRLVRGRLRFEGAKSSAPFPSAVVVWEYYTEGPPKFSSMRPTKRERGV